MKDQKKIKVAVAMSGGVDSSVAAAILKKQGYEVVGVFMQFWFPAGETYGENRCCSLKSWHEAQEVAKLLDMPIVKVNFGREFKKKIVDPFLAESAAARTPNPCVACNKFIKFDLLLKYAQTVLGADYLATGHYIKKTDDGKILRPKDLNKDQTYFLYNLKPSQIKRLMFPLSDLTKDESRLMAKKLKLAIHDKPDSQEICFVGESHLSFLKKYLKLKKGKIVDEKGSVLGEHQGLPLYTLGQRNGLGLSGGPWYVIAFNKRANQLVVSKNFDSAKLMLKRINFKSANWLNGAPKLPMKCQAQIRYHSDAADCIVKKSGGKGGKYFAEFKTAPRAPMAGQSIVFYDGDELLGGGIIE